MPDTSLTATTVCSSCRTEFPSALLVCPQCHRLPHAETLKQLVQNADHALNAGDLPTAQASLREALELLPPETRQYQAITARLESLAHAVDQTPSSPTGSPGTAPTKPESRWNAGAGAAGAGTLALLLWKFKFLLLLALTKGKLLLLGLTKASTLFSMLLSVGVYWSVFGWWFALGLVLSIYVHEMGHVAALRRYGIRADAPLFIPGLGAMIRLRQTLPDARADARVGLAGPVPGLAGALAAYGASLATGVVTLAAIARFAAWVNLFNLLPVWQLDGNRGFRAFSRSQRWFAALTIAVMWSITGEGLLLLLIAASIHAATQKPANDPDARSASLYAVLVAALSLLSQIPVSLAR